MRPSKAKIIELVRKAIQTKKDRLVDMPESPIRQYELGQKNALEDVLSALRGDDVYLRILASK